MMVDRLCYKKSTFNDLVDVMSVHPGAVTTNLNNFMKSPDAVTADECALGSMASFGGGSKRTMGGFNHTILFNTLFALVMPFPSL